MITLLGDFCKGVTAMHDISLQEAYVSFISNGESYWANATLVYYRKNLGYFLQYLGDRFGKPLDSLMLSELPDTIFVEYIVFLRSKERYAGHPLRGCMNVSGTIKSNTVRTYCRAVKAFFNYLYRNRYTYIRYTEDVRLPKSDDDMIVPLLESEAVKIDSIFDASVPNDLRNLCIIHLMLDAGLRSCEVIALGAGDVIFSNGTIVVNRSKGNKSRVVKMCPKLSRMLQAYVDVYSPSGTFFRRVGCNKGINEDVIKALFLRVRRNTGICRLHPHLLRHTFATSYIMGGGNLETLRLLMGHYDYSVTRIYLHLANQYLIMDADIYRLDPVFFKSRY